GGCSVVDSNAGRGCMQIRCLDVCLRRIGAHDASAQTHQRFAQNAAATADVQQPQVRKRIEPPLVAAEMSTCSLLDEGEPHWVELMQDGHLPASMPPLGGALRKMRNLR